MQAQKEAPPDMHCRDKFLIQTVVTKDGSTTKDVTAELVLSFFKTMNWQNIELCSKQRKIRKKSKKLIRAVYYDNACYNLVCNCYIPWNYYSVPEYLMT